MRPRGFSLARTRRARGSGGSRMERTAHGQAASERRNDWPRRPWQVDPHERDHEGDGGRGPRTRTLARRDRPRAEERTRGITINLAHVAYESETRHYAHVD